MPPFPPRRPLPRGDTGGALASHLSPLTTTSSPHRRRWSPPGKAHTERAAAGPWLLQRRLSHGRGGDLFRWLPWWWLSLTADGREDSRAVPASTRWCLRRNASSMQASSAAWARAGPEQARSGHHGRAGRDGGGGAHLGHSSGVWI
jgi:hypothetical protein